jgi:hypothetical protein
LLLLNQQVSLLGKHSTHPPALRPSCGMYAASRRAPRGPGGEFFNS